MHIIYTNIHIIYIIYIYICICKIYIYIHIYVHVKYIYIYIYIYMLSFFNSILIRIHIEQIPLIHCKYLSTYRDSTTTLNYKMALSHVTKRFISRNFAHKFFKLFNLFSFRVIRSLVLR